MSLTPIYNISTLEVIKQPSYTYKITSDGTHIAGMVDGKEAVLQSIQKLLNTERYESVIYSSNYGVEFGQLIGKDIDYIRREVERMTVEALAVDDRIIRVEDFSIEHTDHDNLNIMFKIITTDFSFYAQLEVNI